MTYGTPLNLVHCLLFHKLFKLTSLPSFVYPTSSFGTTVYAHLTPVNPAVFEKLLNSIATFLAPSISYILCGMSSSTIKLSYALSNKIKDLFSIA